MTTLSPRLLILVGVPGSGKSTLAIHLCRLDTNWVRVNQDELGSRKECEWAARRAFENGKNVIVDRCNFDISQRKVWLKLGLECGVRSFDAIVLNTPEEVCRNRILHRTHHETEVQGEKGVEILLKFRSMFCAPVTAEGLDRILVIDPLNAAMEGNEIFISDQQIRETLGRLNTTPLNSEAPSQRERVLIYDNQDRPIRGYAPSNQGYQTNHNRENNGQRIYDTGGWRTRPDHRDNFSNGSRVESGGWRGQSFRPDYSMGSSTRSQLQENDGSSTQTSRRGYRMHRDYGEESRNSRS